MGENVVIDSAGITLALGDLDLDLDLCLVLSLMSLIRFPLSSDPFKVSTASTESRLSFGLSKPPGLLGLVPGSDLTVSSPDELDPKGNPNLSLFGAGIGFMGSIGSGTSPRLVPNGGRWLSEEEPLAVALLLTSPWPNLLSIGGLES